MLADQHQNRGFQGGGCGRKITAGKGLQVIGKSVWIGRAASMGQHESGDGRRQALTQGGVDHHARGAIVAAGLLEQAAHFGRERHAAGWHRRDTQHRAYPRARIDGHKLGRHATHRMTDDAPFLPAQMVGQGDRIG